MAIAILQQSFIRILLCFGVIALVACGGGGGEKKDTTPNAFTIAAVQNATVSSQVESASITVTGINKPAAISIVGGEYAINDSEFTAVAATVSKNQTVKVRVTTSANTNTPVVATLTIGGVSATFTVTTAPDITPDVFSFEPNSVTEAEPNNPYTSNTITVNDIDIPVAISITNGEYKIGDGAYTSTAGTISNGQTVTVKITAPNATDATETATLTIGGVTATYSVTTYPDEVAPTASIAFPPPMTATEDDNVIIRGTAQDDFNEITSLTVKVNDTTTVAATSDDGFATWQAAIPLTAGVNTLVVNTTDAQNNTDTNAAQVVVTQQDFGLAFPNNDVGIRRITAMTLNKENNRVFVMDAGTEGVRPWKMIAIDLTTGLRSIFSDPATPNDQEIIVQSNAIVLDLPRNRALVGAYSEGSENSIYSISLENNNLVAGTRTLLSSSRVPTNTQPALEVTQGIVIDPTNSEVAYVLGEVSQNLARMSVLTGERTLVSDNNIPDSGDLFDVPLDIEIDADGQHAWVVEQTNRAILNVDLTTGMRTSLDMTGYPAHVNGFRTNSIVANQARTHFWVLDRLAGLIAYDIENAEWSLVWAFPRNTTFGNSLFGYLDVYEDNNYLIFADESTDGVYAVDLETSEMVIISKMLDD